MRIIYIVPGTGIRHEEQQRREEILNSIAAPGTQISVLAVQHGPPCIESEDDEQKTVPHILAFMDAHQDRCDAFIIGCAGDAGLEEARARIGKPVIGPGESSLLLGTPGHARFAIITANAARVDSKYRLVGRAGLNPQRLIASLSVDIPVLNMRRDLEKTLEALVMTCMQARQAGASVTLLGCMSLAFSSFQMLQTAQERSGIPIVNPVVSAVRLAEALTSLHVTAHSA